MERLMEFHSFKLPVFNVHPTSTYMLVILGEYSQRIEGSGREIGQGIERRIEFDISI